MYRAPAYACPACRADLAVDGARWSCRACGGTFVPAAELAAAICTATGWTVEPHVDAAGWHDPARPCPVCSSAMAQVALAGRIASDAPPVSIAIDRCDDHGVWFDRDELAAVAAHHQPAPDAPVLQDTTPSDKLTTTAWLLDLLGL